MNPWASRRKGIVFFIVFVFALLVLILFGYIFTRSTPLCDNGLQDGDETGVDCGGSCKLICTPETLPLIARGEARVLKISDDTYVTSILIENPNTDGEVVRAPYTISIYTSGVREPVIVINRSTYIGRSSTFALFEGPFVLTENGPFRAVFEWGDNLVWEKTTKDLPLIAVDGINLLNASTSPRLEAKLTNRTTKLLNNIEVVALLSDENSNTIYAGKTFLDAIPPGEAVPVSFIWPEAFSSNPVTIRILPHVLPDKSYLR